MACSRRNTRKVMAVSTAVPRSTALARKGMCKKKTSLHKLKIGFRRRGNNWVEPLREWVLDTKQAAFLSSSDNFSEIASFVQKIGTNHTVRDKSARFFVPVPSHFVATRRGFLPLVAPSARPSSALTDAEVSFCAGERNRTPAYWLEASRFTIKLRPHSTVYVGYSSTFSIQALINREKPTPNFLSPAERTVT